MIVISNGIFSPRKRRCFIVDKQLRDTGKVFSAQAEVFPIRR